MKNVAHTQTRLHQKAVQDLKNERLAPPDDMPEPQQKVWHMTVAALPSTWFAQEQTAMLALYCAHVVRAAQIEAALVGVDPVNDLATFDKLVKLAALESSKIAMHARSMRLTQQSRMKAETSQGRAFAAAHASTLTRKPWETENEFAKNGDKNRFFDDLIARPI